MIADKGYFVGGEVSLALLREGNHVGFYTDGYYDWGANGAYFTGGLEAGHKFLGVDGGIATRFADGGHNIGFTGRLSVGLGILSLYGRFMHFPRGIGEMPIRHARGERHPGRPAAREAPARRVRRQLIMKLTVNAASPSTSMSRATTPLLWVLREEVGLTGTKFGCGMALCGACTVHVDGRPKRSCVTACGDIGEEAGRHDRRGVARGRRAAARCSKRGSRRTCRNAATANRASS